jgi:CheY-like chemotaxis protein
MASATLKPAQPVSPPQPPRLLVVDDEPEVLALLRDTIPARLDCTLSTARDLGEARDVIAREAVDLLLTDLHLPDGDGISLLPVLRERCPSSAAVVITGRATVESAVVALRAGAVDFVAKPFSIDQVVERIGRALRRQNLVARNDRRIGRLKDAVRRLNRSRKLVSKKVDLLCNDLIGAYGELSKQVEDIRNQESFRRLVQSSKDLEQMLCHAMDWVLRSAGYCNLAIWLAADDADFQLGAYMKYTISGEPALTDAMKQNLVPMAAREGMVQLEGFALKKQLSPEEFKFLKGQAVLATNCTYLGESLAVMVLFRDEKCPFTPDDSAMLKAIAPVFATALASMVRSQEEGEAGPDEYGDAGGSTLGPGNDADTDLPNDTPDADERRRRQRRKKEQHDADWWKRGEPPPF